MAWWCRKEKLLEWCYWFLFSFLSEHHIEKVNICWRYKTVATKNGSQEQNAQCLGYKYLASANTIPREIQCFYKFVERIYHDQIDDLMIWWPNWSKGKKDDLIMLGEWWLVTKLKVKNKMHNVLEYNYLASANTIPREIQSFIKSGERIYHDQI